MFKWIKDVPAEVVEQHEKLAAACAAASRRAVRPIPYFDAGQTLGACKDTKSKDAETRVKRDIDEAVDRLQSQEWDYTLRDVAQEMTYPAVVRGDSIVVLMDGYQQDDLEVVLDMVNDGWRTAGHQYSQFGRWVRAV